MLSSATKARNRRPIRRSIRFTRGYWPDEAELPLPAAGVAGMVLAEVGVPLGRLATAAPVAPGRLEAVVGTFGLVAEAVPADMVELGPVGAVAEGVEVLEALDVAVLAELAELAVRVRAV